MKINLTFFTICKTNLISRFALGDQLTYFNKILHGLTVVIDYFCIIQLFYMNQFFKRKQIAYFLPLITLLGFSSCNKDISISLDNTGAENLGLTTMDTATIVVSSYQMDDIPTSATGILLVGKSNNPTSGKISSSSFMRLGIPTETLAIPSNATFDSLTLVIKPNKYFYGDTTKIQKISVHQVTEDIKLTEINLGKDPDERPVFVSTASIFNDQKFAYNATALGTASFSPRVRTMDSLAFKLDATLGNRLFGYLQTGDARVSSNTNFQEFFKGLVLIPAATNTALIGYKDSVFMNVHYSYVGSDGFSTKAKKTFSIDNKNYQHNNITYDRSGTAFASLNASNPEIFTSATAGTAFLEGGTGVVARLQFPSLLSIVSDPKIAINKAELIIEAENSVDAQQPNPAALEIFIANKIVNPIGQLTAPQATVAQSAPFEKGNDTGKNGKYTFNMIEYLNNIKKTAYFDSSLLVSLPTSQLFTTGNRLVIAKSGGKPKIKLNIIYTKF